MGDHGSSVLEFGAPEPGETTKMMEDKLRFYADARDLALDLRSARPGILVIDFRSRNAYAAGHITGAMSLLHCEMNAETAASFDRSKVYIVYCDGIGCNASIKGATSVLG